MADVDHFKRVNDKHGHLVGDEALRCIVKTLQAQQRVTDLVCRYGGEEFCVILPETNEEAPTRAAERLRSAVERSNFSHDSLRLSLTVSIGVAGWNGTTRSEIPDLLALADDALLEAKRAGRNQVRLAGGPAKSLTM